MIGDAESARLAPPCRGIRKSSFVYYCARALHTVAGRFAVGKLFLQGAKFGR